MRKLFLLVLLCFSIFSNTVFAAETIYSKSVEFPSGQSARYVVSEKSSSEFIIHAYSDHRSKEFHEMMTYLAAKQARENGFKKDELLQQKKRPGAIKKPLLSARFRGYNGEKRYAKNQSLNVAQFAAYYETRGEVRRKRHQKEKGGLRKDDIAGIVVSGLIGGVPGVLAYITTVHHIRKKHRY